MEKKISPRSNDLSDNREPYDFVTKYPSEAWKRIRFEAIYLAIVLLLASVLVVLMVAPMISGNSNYYYQLLTSIVGKPKNVLFLYILIAKFGMIGGTLFDIKWLIHSVAKGTWNEDRLLWRLFTPHTSAVTAAFFALVIQSGIIALFDESSFQSYVLAAAFAMLVGYFADGVIGVLSNMAGALFGTVQDRKKEMK